MPQARLLIFDDGRGDFGPLTDRRAIFEQRSGACTTRQRLERLVGREADALRVPPRLAAVLRQRSGRPVNVPLADGPWLVLNGRFLGLEAPDGRVAPLRAVLRGGAPSPTWRQVTQARGGQLIAAFAPAAAEAEALLARVGPAERSSPSGEGAEDSGRPMAALPRHADADVRLLVERPWHFLATLDAALRADADASALPRYEGATASAGVTLLGGHAIKVAPSARLHPMVVLNAEKGPILIERDAVVGSFAVLAGPCAVGEGTIVGPHSHVRPGSAIGPQCVVAGEVSHSILQGHSNKAHAGYLGHSLVGEWVNLGADTTVSNLKNTYGSVRVQLSPDGQAQDSGEGKLGPLIGDFVRTAIGTRLLTGSVVGTGTMLAVSGFAPKCAGRFEFHTDALGAHGGAGEAYELDKFLATARTMTRRRGVELAPAEFALLRALARREC